MTEREITRPVDLARGRRLNPEAVGWSRAPVHRTRIAGWGRTKRWEYWGIVTDRFVVGLTVAGLDYLANCAVYVLDRRTGEETTRSGIRPLHRPRFGDDPGDGSLRAAAGVGAGRVGIEVDDDEGRTSIRAQARGLQVSLEVTRPGHDSLAVVVPWSERRFQYTLKDLANPVTGTVTLDGATHELGTGWAVLDRGRGRWRYATTWNWGAGSGVVDGSTRAIQVGGKWTDGTGSTENGILVDGRMRKLSEDLRWSYDLADPAGPWRVRGERLDAMLTPFHLRRDITELGVLAVKTHQAFGVWDGTGVLDDGSQVSLDGLVGWAEQSRNRW
ncbi:DUF2804 domain-containing protein [Dietzia maris]|uniref:DUF2804 domain-containing protein n=1 Tax=Dietzia TaxID=37914 RepID=UPI0022B3F358|nr:MULTISPECIES: DUF2804 domain-containing protein [Dietzia]MCZ4540035.1 DUF2804 domain-containing protein [Dietzia maris]MCZ4655597.1 DUF2804 domain-containing protein [Dietzia kunjamensis]MDJ0422057.1 DUF2804 domain-containing protein [Dietzia kunjamensis]MDV3356078.1 DUF2804 domain-containing protein [Dietzia sp. IN118]